jgi:hypothetical protein
LAVLRLITNSNLVDCIAGQKCYTNVNANSAELERSLSRVISVPVGWTGLASLRDGYDEVAWKSIRSGREIGYCGRPS